MVHATTALLAGTLVLFSPTDAAQDQQAETLPVAPQPDVHQASPNTAEEGNLALEFLRHLPPTAAGAKGEPSRQHHGVPAPLLTPPSISGFTDPESQVLEFPEAF